MYSVSRVLDQIKLDIGPDLHKLIIKQTEYKINKHIPCKYIFMYVCMYISMNMSKIYI